MKGLPSASIITAEIDPLRSEGQMLAEKLRAAGVPVRYKNFDGVTHESFGMSAVLPEAKNAVKFAAEGLQESFKRAPTSGVGNAPGSEAAQSVK